LRAIVETYRREWERLGLGVEVPAHYFTNHADVEVCNLAIQLLTSEEQYVASQLWQRKEIHVESESELLSVGVPKVMLLYKSKVVDRLIAAQNERLANPELSEEEETECVRKLAQLNQVKLRVSKLSQRNIL
jgi:DNA primase